MAKPMRFDVFWCPECGGDAVGTVERVEAMAKLCTEGGTMTTTEMERQLQGAAAIFETPIETREVLDEFALLTYDIPNNEEGQKARYEFLKNARRIGAIQHTESVYLCPWTHDFNMATIQVAQVGKVYVWYAKPDRAGRTVRMLDDLAEVIKRRGSQRLWYELERIRRDLGRLLVQVEV